MDLSLYSFLLEYSRTEHGRCLCLTGQSSHCRVPMRFAYVDLGAPDSGHHLYSEKSCGQIQKGASGTDTGLRETGMTGLVLQKFLTGLAQMCFAFETLRHSAASSMYISIYLIIYPSRYYLGKTADTKRLSLLGLTSFYQSNSKNYITM